MTITLVAPSASIGAQVQIAGVSYLVGSDGTVSVPDAAVPGLLASGFRFYNLVNKKVQFTAPKTADLVFVKAAADIANGVITIANQPPYAAKLQIRIVDANSSISAGNLTVDYVDQNGVTRQDVIAAAGGTRTVKTTYACAKLIAGTVAGLVGAATGDTLGIGMSADLGIPTEADAVNFSLLKATKIISTFTGSGTAVTTVAVLPTDDVAATATLDTTAFTVSPTTAPGPTATTSTDYELTVQYGVAS